MTDMGASALPGLTEEVSILEGALHHSITGWKSELRSVKRSMSKAGAKEILSEKISRLRRSGEEYKAAFDRYTDRRFELGLVTSIQQPLQADQLDRGEGVWPTCSRGQILSLGPPARSLLRLSPTLANRLPDLGRPGKMPPDPDSRARSLLVLELLTMRFTTQDIARRADWSLRPPMQGSPPASSLCLQRSGRSPAPCGAGARQLHMPGSSGRQGRHCQHPTVSPGGPAQPGRVCEADVSPG